LATIKRQNSELLKSVDKLRRSKTPSITTTVDFITEDSKKGLLDLPHIVNKKSDKIYDRSDIVLVIGVIARGNIDFWKVILLDIS